MQALEIAQAKEFVDKKEGGLDFLVEQGGKNLSRRTETASDDRSCYRKETGYPDFRRQCIGVGLCDRCKTAYGNP